MVFDHLLTEKNNFLYTDPQVGGKQGVCCSRTRFYVDLPHKNNENLMLWSDSHFKPLQASAINTKDVNYLPHELPHAVEILCSGRETILNKSVGIFMPCRIYIIKAGSLKTIQPVEKRLVFCM